MLRQPAPLRGLLLLILAGALFAGAPASAGPVDDARGAIEEFFTAFNDRYNPGISDSLHFPHVRINEQGEVRIWETRAEAVVDFNRLTAEGWHQSSLDEAKAVQSGPNKVHFEVTFSRFTEDGTLYATYRSMWVVTRRDVDWGITARSSFAP